jgi:hypothetical protein
MLPREAWVTAHHVDQQSADILAGPWTSMVVRRSLIDVARLRQRMCASPGHRPDTGVSTQLVRLPVLSAAESAVVAELLGQLAGSDDREVADMATEMANRLRDRLSL